MWPLETKYVLLQSLQEGPNTSHRPTVELSRDLGSVSVKESNPKRRLTYLTQSKEIEAHARMPANDHRPLKQNSYLVLNVGNAKQGQQKLYLDTSNQHFTFFVAIWSSFAYRCWYVLIPEANTHKCKFLKSTSFPGLQKWSRKWICGFNGRCLWEITEFNVLLRVRTTFLLIWKTAKKR